MSRLKVSLFGHFEVTLDEQPVTRFGTDKTRALLAYLVVEANRVHRRTMLAGFLWPELPEAAAHHNLSQALLTLRQALGDKALPPTTAPFLLATWQTIGFNPASDYTLDVAVFQARLSSVPECLTPARMQALTEALACYQGEFLSEPWVLKSQAFEEWVLFKQVQFHLQAVEALDALVQYHTQRGEFTPATAYARRLITLDPLRESAHRQLMQALALDNRRAEALAHYAACQTLLAQELGLAPAPETTALMQRIRAAPLEAPQLSELRELKTPPVPLVPPPPFVGRAHELARLDATLSLALGERGQIVFVTGAAGSGKTALLEAFSRRALAKHPTSLMVKGNGNAYTGPGNPYWPFIELLRQLRGEFETGIAPTLPQAQHLQMARPVIARALQECGPHLTRLLAGEVPEASDSALNQTGLFDQITRTLHAVAAHYPLVLLLDDLQWADQDSLNLLFHLGHRLAGQHILLVGAFRPAVRPAVSDPDYATLTYLHKPELDQQDPLIALVRELQHRQGAVQIDLAQAEGREFIAAVLDSEPNHLGVQFRETLYQHTEGHALFTTELLRGMQECGDLLRDAQGFWIENSRVSWQALPGRVEAVIATRLGQLLPEWQTLLTVASVEGVEFTVQVLAHILGLPEAELSQRLSGALTRQHYLVIPIGVQSAGARRLARYRFRHLLFQRYLYNRLDPVERTQLHLSVARTLEMLYGEQSAEISLSLARHFELGGEGHKAIRYLLQAGWRATQLAAAEEALRLLTHGLALLNQLTPSPEYEQQEADLQLALGTALLAKGWSAPERAQASARAYELCQRIGAPEQLARSLLLSADVQLAQGHLDQVIAIGEQLHDLSQSTGDPLILPFAHYTLGSAYFFKGQLLQARQLLEQATALHTIHPRSSVTFIKATLDVRGRVWLLQTLWALGYPEQAAQCSREALASAKAQGQTFSLGLSLSIGELSLRHYRREPQAMRVALRELAALGRDPSLSIYQLWGTLFQGWLKIVETHDPSSLPQIRQALKEWRAAGSQGGLPYGHVILTEAYLALGKIEAARATAEQSLAQSAATGYQFPKAELLRLKGEALWALGQTTEAEACFLQAIAVAQEQVAKAWELRATMSLCRLRQMAGSLTEFAAARQQLAELYAWYTEGLDTPDLQAAAALLVPDRFAKP